MSQITETLLKKVGQLQEKEKMLLNSLKQREMLYIEKLEELCKVQEKQEIEESDIEKRLTVLESNVQELNSNSTQISQKLTQLSEFLQRKPQIQE